MATQIAMVVFSYYPADPRVRREAEAIVSSGVSVDVICIRNSQQPKKENIEGVRVYRLPIQRKRAGKLRYLWEYACFILLSFFALSLLHMRKRYSIIHVHNMPDILVLSALVPRLCGSKVILDLHDPTPEVFMTKYSMTYSHPVIRLLRLLETWSIGFSNLVLTPNIAFRNLFISRGCPKEKISVLMNSPDEAIFCSKQAKNPGEGETSEVNKFVLMYHGTIVERSGLDIAVYAVAYLKGKIPNLVFHVYGEGDFVKRFIELVDELKLGHIIKYHGFVSLESIAQAIKTIDLGLIPNRRSPFTEINMPTRIFEYLSMGKPVIAPRTKGIMDYFSEKSLYFFDPGIAESLAQAILEVYLNLAQRRAVLQRGMEDYRPHRWEVERQHLVKLVRNLLGIERCGAEA